MQVNINCFAFIYFSLLFYGLVIHASPILNDEYVLSQLIFGEDRVLTHFPTKEDFAYSLKASWLSKRSRLDEYSHFIGCMDLKLSHGLLERLEYQFTEENVHVIYQSYPLNTVCYIIHSPLRKVENSINFRVWFPFPPQLKLHPSVLHPLAPEDLPRYSKLDLSDASIIVVSGSGRKIDYSRNNEFLSLFRDEQTILNEMRSFFRPQDQSILNTFLQKSVSNKIDSQCYSKLSFVSSGSHSFRISNLQNGLGNELKRNECFVALLLYLASQPHVLDIRIKPHPRLFNNYGKGIIQTGQHQQSFPYQSVGLNGTGQVVGVGDTGVDELSCFFENSDGSKVARSTYNNPTFDLSKRKVIQYINYADGKDTKDGHGSHVCGTVAGFVLNPTADSAFINYGGHASGAKIAFFDMSDNGNSISYPPPIGKNVFMPAYEAGARIHSDSWGTVINMYDDECIDIDGFHYEQPDFLAIFAAGNDGADGYYSLGSPSVAKNCLTVGASSSDSISNIAYFSSIGPTFDNRIKPEVVAPGYATTSAAAAADPNSATCNTVSMSGTSMATPAVAGSAALVRQYFEDARFWATMCNPAYSNCVSFSPFGSTVKAVLINSGEPMSAYAAQGDTTEPSASLNAPPDNYQGFGRVFLQNVLPYTGMTTKVSNLYVEELVMSSLQKITYSLSVTDNSIPIKATIVWMDPPNSIISVKMLLNDIDLKISGNGKTYYGNNVAGDDVNNVEQVKIDSPVSGVVYTITLISKVLTKGTSQPLSLVITSGSGTVTNKTTTSISSSESTNALSCASSQTMIRLFKMDRGGDGWGSGNSYQITNSAGSVLVSDTMTSAIPGDSSTTDTFCLANDATYTIKLITSGGNADEMGVDIDQCYLYLSIYQPTGMIALSSTGVCNSCSMKQLGFYLLGSTYAIPYGWIKNSKYVLQQSGTFTLWEGTLATGILSQHFYCIPSGTYNLNFDNVPDEDDFLNPASLYSKIYGVEEYRIIISGCSRNNTGIDLDLAVAIATDERAIITVKNDLSCTISVVSYDDNNDDNDSASSVAGYGYLLALSLAFLTTLLSFF